MFWKILDPPRKFLTPLENFSTPHPKISQPPPRKFLNPPENFSTPQKKILNRPPPRKSLNPPPENISSTLEKNLNPKKYVNNYVELTHPTPSLFIFFLFFFVPLFLHFSKKNLKISEGGGLNPLNPPLITPLPSTVSCNKQIIYTEEHYICLHLHVYSVRHLHIVVKFVSAYYIQVYGSTKLKYSRYQF